MRKNMKPARRVIIPAAMILATLAIYGLWWLSQNTATFTSNISQAELNQNNLNSQTGFPYKLQPVEISGHSLNIPEGFTISEYATDIPSARFMSVGPDGTLFVGTKDNDKIYAVADQNQDGTSDQTNVIDSDLDVPHSVFYYEDDLYVAEQSRVSVYRDIQSNGSFSQHEILVEDLPDGNRLTGGGHKTRTVAVGPDGYLYVSIGSSCNVCEEDDDRRASIMRYNLDGSGGEIFASGLRNTVGYDFSQDGELWGTDMGRDQIGDDIPPEEVNMVKQNNNYGWPYCYGDGLFNPEYPDRERYCLEQTTFPSFSMQAHSAPLGLIFPNEAAKTVWPTVFQDSFFIAFHGSWNRTVPTGYKVVWIDMSQEPWQQYTLVSGWLEKSAEAWGRPVGLVFDNQGNLLISDDKRGVVYKLTSP